MYVYRQPMVKDRHGEKIYGPYEVGYYYTKNDYTGNSQTYWYCILLLSLLRPCAYFHGEFESIWTEITQNKR